MYITIATKVFSILVLATGIPTFHACYPGSELCENNFLWLYENIAALSLEYN